jgi:antitoxin component YwqK of YwqJK toxin-antitoxin module
VAFASNGPENTQRQTEDEYLKKIAVKAAKLKSFVCKGSVASFHEDRESGTWKSWWPNGKPWTVEEYKDGALTKAKRWNEAGVVLVDEEYEADGSRKLKK